MKIDNALLDEKERPDVLVTLVLGDFEIFNLQDEGDLH